MKTLYLGLNPPEGVIHFPIIQIVPRPPPKEYADLSHYTHIVFTSQSAVHLFFSHNQHVKNKIFIAVGKKTKQCIETYGYSVAIVPEEETAEGLIATLKTIHLKDAYLFWPHSSLSRPLLKNYFEENSITYQDCIVYDTKPHLPGPHPSLDEIDEIVFTSSSTVHAYLKYFGKFPDKRLTAIGPITKNTLNQKK